jgi:transcriptional regulator with XRE-family HTH domain
VKDLDADFIRERITQLRLEKGVSEYQMSYDLGHSRGYIYNISSGKALPPMKEFLAICDYFGITPQQFFDESTDSPQLIQRAAEGMRQLDDNDLIMLIGLIDRLKSKV